LQFSKLAKLLLKNAYESVDYLRHFG
jgi:hypothetical protein